MEVKIIKKRISKEELKEITERNFETMVKVDIDIEKEILSIGGEWHSEGEELLVRDGSDSQNVWGINFYPWNTTKERIEYISLINVKPAIGHKTMKIKDEKIKDKINKIVKELLLDDNEKIENV
jgi:hypothetical protein